MLVSDELRRQLNTFVLSESGKMEQTLKRLSLLLSARRSKHIAAFVAVWLSSIGFSANSTAAQTNVAC